MSSSDDSDITEVPPPAAKRPRYEDNNPNGGRLVLPVDDDELQLETDVVVVVGGIEFQENAALLKSCSGYFAAAFKSGMKESQSMRFEFPERDPKEWELIRKLLRPFPKQKINEDNVAIVLAWCDELCIKSGLEQCGEVLMVISDKYHEVFDKKKVLQEKWICVDKVLDALVLAQKYGLRSPKSWVILNFKYIFQHVKTNPKILQMKHLKVIESLVASDYHCRHHWFCHGVLEDFLPKNDMSLAKWKILAENNMFAEVLYAGIKSYETKKQCQAMVKIIKDAQPRDPVSYLKKTLLKDDDASELLKNSAA